MHKFFKIIFHSYYFWILITLVGFTFTVHAAVQLEGVEYPILELGSCQNQEACATYCDKSENMDACIAYGVSKGMLSQEEANVAVKAVAKIKAGTTPGGCKDRESCSSFCQNNIDNLNVCISFAEEIGAPPAEIEQAKKIAKAIENGAGLPGNCNGKSACEAYCKNDNHIDECLAFAEAAEILPPAELAEAKKVAKFIKSGEMPGGCKGKDECRTYCDKDENFQECISFAGKAELISPEELEMAKKTGGKGLGDCKSKQTCEDYCNKPENAEACANFALDKGLLSDEEKDNLVNGVAKIKTGLESIPPEIKGEVEDCLNTVMDGNLAGVLSGEQKITRDQGAKIQACFMEATQNYATQQAAAGAAAGEAQQGSSSGGQGINPEDLKDVPAEMQEQIQQKIQERQQEEINKNTPKNIPTNIPQGSTAPKGATGGPVAAPQQDQMPKDIPKGPDCSVFASVPSCSLVGGGQAETYCKKCFPNK